MGSRISAKRSSRLPESASAIFCGTVSALSRSLTVPLASGSSLAAVSGGGPSRSVFASAASGAGTPSNITATPTPGTTAATFASTSTAADAPTFTATLHSLMAATPSSAAPRTSRPDLEISAS